jgi:hypothetical protein
MQRFSRDTLNNLLSPLLLELLTPFTIILLLFSKIQGKVEDTGQRDH